MTKVYALARKYSAYFETEYCGVRIPLSFTVGSGNEGVRRSELVVTDKFTQDAIEHDPRFGHDFFLSGSYDNDNHFVEPVAVEQAKPEPVVRRTRAEIEAEAAAKVQPVVEPEPETVEEKPVVEKPKRSRSKKTAAPVEDKPQVKTFATVNDAIYYLENTLGIEVDEDNIDAQLKENNLAVEA